MICCTQGESEESLPPGVDTDTDTEDDTDSGDSGDAGGWWRGKRSSPPRYGGGFYGSAYSQYKDAIQGFLSSGVVVMTDLMLETRPCIRPRYGKINPPTTTPLLYSHSCCDITHSTLALQRIISL